VVIDKRKVKGEVKRRPLAQNYSVQGTSKGGKGESSEKKEKLLLDPERKKRV